MHDKTTEELERLWEKELRIVGKISSHDLSLGRNNADGFWYDTATCKTCGFFFALGRDGEIDTVESGRYCKPKLVPAYAY